MWIITCTLTSLWGFRDISSQMDSMLVIIISSVFRYSAIMKGNVITIDVVGAIILMRASSRKPWKQCYCEMVYYYFI